MSVEGDTRDPLRLRLPMEPGRWVTEGCSLAPALCSPPDGLLVTFEQYGGRALFHLPEPWSDRRVRATTKVNGMSFAKGGLQRIVLGLDDEDGPGGPGSETSAAIRFSLIGPDILHVERACGRGVRFYIRSDAAGLLHIADVILREV